ncbi:MAG TPA: hypothetical protein VMU22_04390 [Rhizomicrobium sp.]|nr:hypothetical protein [Rhizomicrobium sp.]
MPLTSNEAADALRDLSETERRSARAYGYHNAAPHLILWGLIWIGEYGGYYLFPHYPLIFPILSFVGVLGSFVIGTRMQPTKPARFSWRYFTTFIAFVAFMSALFAIMPPTRGEQIGAFFPLVVALAYTLMGIWLGLVRIGIVGIAIGLLTLVGHFYLQQYYLLWFAFVGGGALILGGLWLRRI